ncbi:carbamoyltransferase HypF [Streptomyces vietnamensis]|uniref:Carbamoyltransferase n=1 Tax=Streptomyces vietnamensis TaxID=362257 RepID=A0A0B5HME0_9ACTN|nr:carbamoyltransferase HypF [Streptomyces vietnamensis]AJF63250.1 hydrogenase maturation protein HypF [Streptomyces vietnamensis]
MSTARPGPAPATAPLRSRVVVRGVVQGVGFRPFVYALATGLRLSGHVTNTADGVVAEVEGDPADVASFCARLAPDAPPLARVESVETAEVTASGGSGFTIVPSRRGGAVRTLVPPDTATCEDCLAELADPADRRYLHPFITCTNCGPRFTIVTGLPYDRVHTTMAAFPMCPDCAREYEDPADRRFHAQPVACPRCGPRLRLVTTPDRPAPSGPEPHPRLTSDPGDAPVAAARRMLASGAILAVKGLGGYHLACDATNPDAVAELRRRKARGDKPFAMMAADLADIEPLVHLGPLERELLTGRVRPVVLLRRRDDARPRHGAAPARAVAPGSPDLGFMLPYTPVHHLLLGLGAADREGPRLLVMTSGNLSGEPIVTDDAEALTRLAGLADAWLLHDRPIHVPCDDSVVRVCDGEQLTLRRSRGYAPLPVTLPVDVAPALAVGGDLKNTFCLGAGRQAWLSAHIGDMDDLATQLALASAERRLESVTGVRPELLAADRHPVYRSSRWAREHAAGRPVVPVQHHHAHVAAAMAENGLDGTRPVIGVAFDGTGYGLDGAVWGGEFLLADYAGFRRFAHLAYVPLPGGDAAVRRPYRMALSHLRAAGLAADRALPCARACEPGELPLLERQLERELNCVPTSSMGRLFDAVSSIVGICQHAGYEAQAAIELEAAALRAPGVAEDARYAFRLGSPEPGAPLTADPAPLLAAVVADVLDGTPAVVVAARFHRAVARWVRVVCAAARDETGVETVALTGGVFANTVLSSACAEGLREDGFTVLRHRQIPPNDGGLALGQLVVAARITDGAAAGTPRRERN